MLSNLKEAMANSEGTLYNAPKHGAAMRSTGGKVVFSFGFG